MIYGSGHSYWLQRNVMDSVDLELERFEDFAGGGMTRKWQTGKRCVRNPRPGFSFGGASRGSEVRCADLHRANLL